MEIAKGHMCVFPIYGMCEREVHIGGYMVSVYTKQRR
jgi:hypothetical protein